MLLPILLAFLSALSSSNSLQQNSASANPSQDHLVIQRRRIVLVRSAKLAKQFPHRRTAIVSYPVIKAFSDPVVLRRVRSLIEFKNLFDYTLQEYRNDSWLSEFDYSVNYNRHYLFDITFTQSGVAAYPDEHTKHFLINLKTGRVIKASDVFVHDKLPELAALVDEKLQAELKEIAEHGGKAAGLDDVESKSIIEGFDEFKFDLENLDEFSVNDKGITFLYDAGLPHAVKAFEPVGKYLFSYSQLKPYLNTAGPLARFIR
jgi:hypothetical protein